MKKKITGDRLAHKNVHNGEFANAGGEGGGSTVLDAVLFLLVSVSRTVVGRGRLVFAGGSNNCTAELRALSVNRVAFHR